MNEVYEKLMKCRGAVEKKVTFKPELALVLGSGLGDFCDTMDVRETATLWPPPTARAVSIRRSRREILC